MIKSLAEYIHFYIGHLLEMCSRCRRQRHIIASSAELFTYVCVYGRIQEYIISFALCDRNKIEKHVHICTLSSSSKSYSCGKCCSIEKCARLTNTSA